MTQFTKPMQPCNADLEKIKFPCVAQKKIDGMKLIVMNDDGKGIKLLGRSMKPIPNQWLHEIFFEMFKDFVPLKHFVFEGELQAGGRFSNCDGMLSAKYRKFDDIIFWMFDEITDTELPYSERYMHVEVAVQMINDPRVRSIGNYRCPDMESLMALHSRFEQDPMLDRTIVRWLDSKYKAGKRTENEQYVLKIKNEQDMEVTIQELIELEHNRNVGYTNALGRTERSTSQAGLVGGNTLGSFRCKTDEGVEVFVGSFLGMSRAEGQKLWKKRNDLIGKKIKIKYMTMSRYGVPLHPVFLGFRDPIDLD